MVYSRAITADTMIATHVSNPIITASEEPGQTNIQDTSITQICAFCL